LAAALIICLLSLNGCGDKNDQSSLDPETGSHPAGWLPGGHVAQARADITTCGDCHGTDYSGGISKVSCTQCHLGDATHVHPLSWDDLIYVRHADFVRANGTNACANLFCHGGDLAGVAGSGPSCTSCHIGSATTVHPWINEAADLASTPPLHAQYYFNHGSTAASCRNAVCHGTQLQGVLLSGPPCSACHFGKVFP
jgi:hypothetical protein